MWTITLDRYTRAGMSGPSPESTQDRTHKGHTPNPWIEMKIPDPAGNRTLADELEGRDDYRGRHGDGFILFLETKE